MLNLFKRQWLPDYIRDYILKCFPAKDFKVEFRINGKMVDMGQVVGNERRIENGIVTYTDSEGNTVSETLGLYKGEITFNRVDYVKDDFALKGIEPGLRKNPRVGGKVSEGTQKEVVKGHRL